jgi:succinyl-diaminopimelate desuccinylase
MSLDSDSIELARALIRRPSVTPDDAGCQAVIADLLGAAGFTVEPLRFGEVDNLWAHRGQGEPSLVFAGHTDVVPPGPEAEWLAPPFEARIENGLLKGRGAADMKGSLAAMIVAALRFVERHPDHPGSIGFLLTSDEEGAADDGTIKVMEALAQRGELFRHCIVGEPSSSRRLGDTVRIGRRGSLSGIMTVRGIQGHVAYPLEADNPMHAIARFIAAVTREPIDAGNRDFPPTTFQMVYIHSDAGAVNVVPGELSCRFNFRYSTQWNQQTLAAWAEDKLKAAGVDYAIRWRNAGQPFLTERGKLTEAVTAAVHQETGIEPELSTSGGTSDGRFIAPYGIDVVEVGPINKTIHKVNEEVAIDDLKTLERIYLSIAERMLLS